ncbi:MAG: valine--tRNA ligase [Thermanaerothrix sp.]|nr:valine--tRNA ligase [Thermanaerothrix sp.]
MREITLGKSYDPVPIEDKWYGLWLENDVFKADPDSKKPKFSIVIPPPNVTGSLHMGHALNNTLQDIVCRYKRMKGYEVLWLPGTDHAGIATQNVVERHLASQGVSRKDLGREGFVEKVWEWKEQYGSRIISQLKKLGASCDWSRERFTMDEGLSLAVRKVFVELYRKNLIYRGKYLINWCPRCRTALSDLEVEHEERDGKLYEVAYRFADGEGALHVMTTRPETILGDVAIAVHPRDERNRSFVGRNVVVPIVGRVIPVIEDNMVDPEFGTGCVKITPAHDHNDFLVGQRHGLEAIQVIDDEGIMTAEAHFFAGMDRFEARERMVKALEESGVLVRVIEHRHSVGHCYRCHTIVEPYLSEQWFVRAKPLAEAGVKAVKEGRIKWVPENWVNIYYQWMENIRDWCISRQLWWGHRIPAWYCSCGEVIVDETTPSRCPKCGSSDLRQDEDVLDTWFSSALWPFSTMGWPERTKELESFYPTGLLVTGFDIIFFWVARMIMMGLEFMDDVPFRDVYIHALVRDEKGQKMSKSKGNVIDPLDIIEKYGADALRMTLAALTVQGRDICLSSNRIETYRFFLNKIWNASRFALMNLEEGVLDGEVPSPDPKHLRLHDRWILHRLKTVLSEMERLLEGYYFGESARLLYDFTWSEVCDWYLELVKPAIRGDEGEDRRTSTQRVLLILFRDLLRMMHPFIPFVTEEIWHHFPFGSSLIMSAGWPSYDFGGILGEEEVEVSMGSLQELIKGMRNLRAEASVPPQKQLSSFVIRPRDQQMEVVIQENQDLICLMTKCERLELCGADAPSPSKSLACVLPQVDVFLPVEGLWDIEGEIKRLSEEEKKVLADIDRISAKLSNRSFVERAPVEVVEKERCALEERRARLERIRENIRSLSC